MTDEQTTDQPTDESERGYPAGTGNVEEAQESAKTNVAGEHTDDESKIAEHGSMAHNERKGQEK